MVYRRTAGVQARLDEQRARIVGAATYQLARHGYAGCSIVAVARRAGVATGTVYNHFADKSELIAEIFRTVVTGEVDAVRGAVTAAPDTTTRVSAFISTFAGRALKSPRLAFALLAEPVDATVDALRLEFRIAFRDIAADAIRKGIIADEIPAQDALLSAAALVGAIGEALVGPLRATADPAAIDALISFALRSLGVRHAVNA